MKITRMNGKEESINYTQIKTAGIDPNYAIINDGEGDEYWELEPGTLHHSYLMEDESWFNGHEDIKEAEVLTDALVSIFKC